MDPARRRAIRLVVALAAAVSLAAALVYASFATANETRTPSQLLAGARPGRTYQLTGVVEAGSVQRHRGVLSFGVRDRAGGRSVEVRYTGLVPDAFRPGREVIVNVRRGGRGFTGVRDSLITKCPSKYTNAPAGQ